MSGNNDTAWMTDEALAANPILKDTGFARIPFAMRVTLPKEHLDNYRYAGYGDLHSTSYPSLGKIVLTEEDIHPLSILK